MTDGGRTPLLYSPSQMEKDKVTAKGQGRACRARRFIIARAIPQNSGDFVTTSKGSAEQARVAPAATTANTAVTKVHGVNLCLDTQATAEKEWKARGKGKTPETIWMEHERKWKRRKETGDMNLPIKDQNASRQLSNLTVLRYVFENDDHLYISHPCLRVHRLDLVEFLIPIA